MTDMMQKENNIRTEITEIEQKFHRHFENIFKKRTSKILPLEPLPKKEWTSQMTLYPTGFGSRNWWKQSNWDNEKQMTVYSGKWLCGRNYGLLYNSIKITQEAIKNLKKQKKEDVAEDIIDFLKIMKEYHEEKAAIFGQLKKLAEKTDDKIKDKFAGRLLLNDII